MLRIGGEKISSVIILSRKKKEYIYNWKIDFLKGKNNNRSHRQVNLSIIFHNKMTWRIIF